LFQIYKILPQRTAKENAERRRAFNVSRLFLLLSAHSLRSSAVE